MEQRCVDYNPEYEMKGLLNNFPKQPQKMV